MGTMLVVDGSDVCRAPIVAFTLRAGLASASWLNDIEVESRGLEVDPAGATMCDSGSARLGFSGPAIAFYGAHRATPLTVGDVAEAGIVVTAERWHRSAVVRMLPGTQAQVFTWKEALVLATVVADRVHRREMPAPTDLSALARALHAVRGTVPLIEPAVRTGPFHLKRAAETDPLNVPDGHDGRVQHRHAAQEARDVSLQLGARLAGLVAEPVPTIRPAQRRSLLLRAPGRHARAR